MSIDWSKAVNARDINRPSQTPRSEPKIDPDVSKIVGKPVRTNDPRLISLVVKHKNKAGNSADSKVSDNYLHSSAFVEELKRTF